MHTDVPSNSASGLSVAITGSGGSGAVTTGLILLQAAAQAGYYALLTRSAGPQIRGGESAAMLRFGPRPVESKDDRFDILPQVASDEHLHPRDLLPSAKSLIVFFIPFKRELVKENKTGDRPSRNWGLAYVQTNDLIHRLSREIEKLLTAEGFKCGLT